MKTTGRPPKGAKGDQICRYIQLQKIKRFQVPALYSSQWQSWIPTSKTMQNHNLYLICALHDLVLGLFFNSFSALYFFFTAIIISWKIALPNLGLWLRIPSIRMLRGLSWAKLGLAGCFMGQPIGCTFTFLHN